MATQRDYYTDDDFCFNCGQVDYAHSRTPGICTKCDQELRSEKNDKTAKD